MNSPRKKLSILIELAIPFALFLILYSFSISENLSATHDIYIEDIETRTNLFHPHHLLYNALTSIWLFAWKYTGLASDSVFFVSILNSIFGALTLSVFCIVLRRRLHFNYISALAGTALLAFSFGFWFYSICIEVYIIPLFFLTLSFYLLTVNNINEKTFAIIGLTHGIAVLFHQTNVLFIIVILIAVFLRYKGRVLSLWRSISYYILTFIPIVTVPYLIIIFSVQRLYSIKKIWFWLTLYTHSDIPWNPLAFSSLFKSLIGFGHSIIGGHFIFTIERLTSFLKKLLRDKWLMDEEFMVRNLNDNIAYIFLGLSVVFLLIVLINFAIRIRYWHLIWRKHSYFIILIIAWFFTYGSFFFLFWQASDFGLWVPQLLCFWLFFLTLWSKPHPSKSPLFLYSSINFNLLIIVALIFTINYGGSIQFLKSKENDYYYTKINPLIKMADKKDLIIIGRSWVLKNFVRYYTKADVLSITDVYPREGDTKEFTCKVQDAINKTLLTGGKVFISKEAIELEQEAIRFYGKGIVAIGKLWDNYKERWEKIDFGLNSIYILQLRER